LSNLFQETTFQVSERFIPLSTRIMQWSKSMAVMKNIQKIEKIIRVWDSFPVRVEGWLGSTA